MTETEWLASQNIDEMMDHVHNIATQRQLRLFACVCVRQTWRFTYRSTEDSAAVQVAERYADGETGRDELDFFANERWPRCVCLPDATEAVREVIANGTRMLGPDILKDIAGNVFQWPRVSRSGKFIEEVNRDRGSPIGCCEDHANNRYCDCHYRAGHVLAEWLTPNVVSLATSAYENRNRRCEECDGKGHIPAQKHYNIVEKCHFCFATGNIENNGSLDPARIGILADALEEAGCRGAKCVHCQGGYINQEYPTTSSYDVPIASKSVCQTCNGTGFLSNMVLDHLRADQKHYRGCWAVDLCRKFKLPNE